MPALAKVSDRAKLKPRRDPYFMSLSSGCAIGVRKMTPGSAGQWVARWRDPDTEKHHHKSLGPLDHLPDNERFDAAAKLAREWFRHLGQGGSTQTHTVADACARYIEHTRRARGDKAAVDVRNRFARCVMDNARFASTDLSKLRPANIEAWRTRLQDTATPAGGKRTASTLNRDVTVFRAALNLAHADSLILSKAAWESKLKPVKGADRQRNEYLDRAQRRKLIDAAAPDLALFLTALCLLPLRPGAMAALTVSSFDRRLKTLAVGQDKAGSDRKITLPGNAALLFEDASKDKLPGAALFTRADGKPWVKDAWKHPFRAAADAAGLPSTVTLYVLRHSVITDLVHGGLDPLTVAQISGTSLLMIERHYGHLRSGTATAALERLAI